MPLVLNNWAQINRICHRSMMQTEKSQPEGKQILLETRLTEFLAFSIEPGVGISRSAWQTYDRLFNFSWKKLKLL